MSRSYRDSLYRSGGKRLLDISLVVLTSVVWVPLLLLTGVLTWLFQGRPVLYRQERVGKEGRHFVIFKFRTMVVGADKMGSVTTENDQRITSLGRFLRKAKLDELPQLLNVLKGDMSLVGPRPEVQEYVERLGSAKATVLSVRPGITALSSVRFRDEGRLLAGAEDPVALNDTYVFPLKTWLNVHYVQHLSLGLDLACLAGTVFPRLLERRIDRLEEEWLATQSREGSRQSK